MKGIIDEVCEECGRPLEPWFIGEYLPCSWCQTGATEPAKRRALPPWLVAVLALAAWFGLISLTFIL